MNLLDASSIYTLVKNAGDEAPKILKANATIPLVNYELGNVVWREIRLLKLLTAEDGKELLSNLYDLVDSMTILPFRPRLEGEAVLESALLTGLSFYDSSYLAAAISTGYPLVTEDKHLARAAGMARVTALSWRDL